jgi:YjbE family integral membrane protein
MWINIGSFLSIVLIDLVLSGDNALVIGMACAGLPPEQRRKGILYGAMAAVLLRVFLAGGAALLLRIPLLQAAGGLMLVWIAYRLAGSSSHGPAAVKQGATLCEAVRTVAAADLVMSLDNVLAVGGVSRGNLPLLLVGLGLTIPIIMWGSSLVATLMSRAQWLSYAGAAVLAWTAGAMVAEDPGLSIPHGHLMPALATVLVLGVTAAEQFRNRA